MLKIRKFEIGDLENSFLIGIINRLIFKFLFSSPKNHSGAKFSSELISSPFLPYVKFPVLPEKCKSGANIRDHNP